MNAVSFLLQPVIQMTKKKALICYGGKKKGGESKECCSEETTLIMNRRLPGKQRKRISILGRRISICGGSEV